MAGQGFGEEDLVLRRIRRIDNMQFYPLLAVLCCIGLVAVPAEAAAVSQ